MERLRIGMVAKRGGVKLILIGIGMGLLVAVGISKYLASFLVGSGSPRPTDASTGHNRNAAD